MIGGEFLKKWLASALLVGIALAWLLPVSWALAAPVGGQVEQEVLEIRRQIHDLRKQIIDKYEAAGKVTTEEAEKIKQKLDERFEWHVKHGFEKKFKEKKHKMKQKPQLDGAVR